MGGHEGEGESETKYRHRGTWTVSGGIRHGTGCTRHLRELPELKTKSGGPDRPVRDSDRRIDTDSSVEDSDVDPDKKRQCNLSPGDTGRW